MQGTEQGVQQQLTENCCGPIMRNHVRARTHMARYDAHAKRTLCVRESNLARFSTEIPQPAPHMLLHSCNLIAAEQETGADRCNCATQHEPLNLLIQLVDL